MEQSTVCLFVVVVVVVLLLFLGGGRREGEKRLFQTCELHQFLYDSITYQNFRISKVLITR